jgi:hypothetical protein
MIQLLAHTRDGSPQALAALLKGVPRSYVSQLLLAAPGLMDMSPALLRAKFNTLLNK